ncbi:MAG: 3'(2'),5'-bisphosphate nucleotidase CysQ [Pseudomonadales bacterium]|nr:3'(2'),5'-bisphosphate nucleotidase CysQ [Pseudomonadales bacterium]
MRSLLDSVVAISQAAGEEILSVYNDNRPIDVTVKDDNSPLTVADRRANAVIVEQLQTLDASIPILSEEIEQPSYPVRSGWQRYWLVDPLDGTKEFINRNGEFTVNIALIDAGEPLLGVVHVPVSSTSYFGGTVVSAAWKQVGDDEPVKLAVSGGPENGGKLRLVASRSHRGELVDRLIRQIETRFSDIAVVSMGSSLKLCLLAEGAADLYPRLAPTSEWDTAAAHAVLRATGGEVLTTEFRPLRYNQKDDILNPHFLAVASIDFDWSSFLVPGLN